MMSECSKNLFQLTKCQRTISRIQRLPPPMNGIKQSMMHDTASLAGKLNRLRIAYKVIMVTINNNKMSPATIFTESETRKMSI